MANQYHRAGVTFAAMLVSLSVGGCASGFSTHRAAVDYNRSFADARNEILILNILRASQREPLQFSTITGVQGSVRTTTQIVIPFTNVIAGGADAISPQITASTRNPQVTITPLATREFTLGIIRPVSFETLQSLAGDPTSPNAFALMIGGVVCQGGRRVMNRGDDPGLDDLFRSALSQPSAYQWIEADGELVANFVLTPAQAADLLVRGVGAGRRIAAITAFAPEGKQAVAAADVTRQTHEVVVRVEGERSTRIAGPNFDAVCASARATPRDGPDRENSDGADGNAAPESNAGERSNPGKATGLLIRSVQGMFQYLGALHRSNMTSAAGRCRRFGVEPETPSVLPFWLRRTCDGLDAPVTAVASTAFHGDVFYVLRDAESHADDRTLETLNLLSELIALQTTDATVAAARPVITISE